MAQQIPDGAPRARRVLLTERDRTLLSFAAEHRFVLAAHLGGLLAITSNAAAARARRLSAAGYLTSDRKLAGEPMAFQITAAGLRAIGSTLPVPREIDAGEYHHDAALAWLMLLAGRGRFGPAREVVSERRMRSQDARGSPSGERFGVRMGGVGPAGRARLHYPDMLLLTASGHRVAFELERTGKSRGDRERILAAYAADRRIDAVVYLVENAATGRAITRTAARLGIGDLISVQRVAPAPSLGTGVGARAVARNRAAAANRAAAGNRAASAQRSHGTRDGGR